MALLAPWPTVRQALMRQLRSNLVLKAALPGDWSEGVAPEKTAYPRGVLSLHFAPAEYDWTGMVSIIGFDAFVYSKDLGEAASLDQLVFTTLQDVPLAVVGQTSLSCRRVSSLSLVDENSEGTIIYQAGGTYEAITAQSNPINRTLVVTVDSTIS